MKQNSEQAKAEDENDDDDERRNRKNKVCVQYQFERITMMCATEFNAYFC